MKKRGGVDPISPKDFSTIIRALPVLGDECDCLIYFNNTKPASIYGGTWNELAQGTFLEAAGDGGIAGYDHQAGLPNIKGSFSVARTNEETTISDGDARLFVKTAAGSGSDMSSHPGVASYAGQPPDLITFDASKSNDIYGKSSTVQPKSITVHIWRKVS